MNGDPGVTSVSVKMMGKNEMEETDKRDGKIISVTTLTAVRMARRRRLKPKIS